MAELEYKDFKKRFIYYFDIYNIEYREKIIRDFYDFTKYLLSENAKYNLTSIIKTDEIIVKHYIDSIMPLKYFEIPENAKIIDIGTGAGFPALPLSIMRNDLKITFLDSSAKKINFIKNAPLTKNNFIFYCARAEELGKNINVRETYNFAVSRAVANFNILCELAAPFINPGEYFISYKSVKASNEIDETKNALKTLGLKITDIKEFELKINNETEIKRIIIKTQKLEKTNPKYPRKFADIIKNPL